MTVLDELSDDDVKALVSAGYRTVADLEGVAASELVENAGLEEDLAQRVAREAPEFKQKPHPEYKRLLTLRKRHDKPWFKRDDYEKKKKLSPSWRKPRGLFNKMRRGFPDKGAVVQVGYGAPKAIRGFHPSGFEEALVHSLADLDEVRPDQAVRIGRTVGARKKQIILERAFTRGLKVLNPQVRGQRAQEEEETPEVQEEEE
jgi:large subunit ribosomal protein L32e